MKCTVQAYLSSSVEGSVIWKFTDVHYISLFHQLAVLSAGLDSSDSKS